MNDKKDNEKLKDCPCCRNKAQLKSSSPDYFSQGDYTKKTYWIKCTVCPIKTGRMRDKKKLIIGWNTRTDTRTLPPPDSEALAAFKLILSVFGDIERSRNEEVNIVKAALSSKQVDVEVCEDCSNGKCTMNCYYPNPQDNPHNIKSLKKPLVWPKHEYPELATSKECMEYLETSAEVRGYNQAIDEATTLLTKTPKNVTKQELSNEDEIDRGQ